MPGLTVLWLALPAHAACDNASLQDHLSEARDRYARQDEDAFRAAMSAAAQDLGCMTEPLRRGTAADWHRTQALLAAVSGGPGARERVVASLRAGLELDPTLALFPGALPESYWSSRNQEARALTLSAPTAVLAEPGARLSVNGSLEEGRRAELPALLQCSNSSGAPIWTRDLAPGEPTPACAPLPSVQEPVKEEPPPACAGRLSRGASFGLLGGALVATGGSLGFFLWNQSLEADYADVLAADPSARDPVQAEADLRALAAGQNRTAIGSVAAATLAGGAAGAVVLRGCFR